MDRHTHIATAEWKNDNPGPDECLMQSFLTEPFPPDPLVEDDTDNEGSDAGFQKHGLSVTVGAPQMEGKPPAPPPPTPQFGQKSGSSSRLSERMQARAGFSVPKLSMPCIPPAAADSSHSGGPSTYLTIPAGLSPASLLESPVFLSNSMGQASPTTGKLVMFGDINSNNPSTLEGPSVEDGTGAFSFSYRAEENKESLPSNQHPQLQSREISVKTETAIQNAQDASQLNQQQFNGQDMMKRSYHDSKRSRPAPETTAVASPPDHGQLAAATAADSEPKGEYPALATAMPAAEDGYSWRKYGQKQVKHSEYPRSYYKCTHPSCQVKKKVEQSFEGHVTEIIYKGTHNHPKPSRSRRPGSPHVHPFSDAQVDAADNSHGHYHHHRASQQKKVEGRPLWHNGGTVQHLRGEGLEATSSPSVPGELCDSSHSMQVHDGTARFESTEGVGITSGVSDEVDESDRVAAHGSMSQGHGVAADAEGDELESKRRKLESCSIEMSTASRAVREPRVVIQTKSEVDILDDGYRWRKYGQKVVKGNPNPRSYYKCTHQGCSVRKHVERASQDHKSVITTYEGKHNHEVPAARNSGGHASSAAYGAAGASQAARRPEQPSLQDGLMRLGSCGAPYGIGLPPRDPLGPMSNYPYTLGVGHAATLPSLPMPAGLGGMEGLKFPMLSPSLHPFYRHRQAMETAGFMVPKDKAPPTNGGAAPGYQQASGRLPLGRSDVDR